MEHAAGCKEGRSGVEEEAGGGGRGEAKRGKFFFGLGKFMRQGRSMRSLGGWNQTHVK